MTERHNLDRPWSELTDQELKLLQLLAEGKTRVEIAKAMCLSTPTVSCKQATMLAKLKTPRNSSLAVWNAIKAGVIRPEGSMSLRDKLIYHSRELIGLLQALDRAFREREGGKK